MALLLLLLVGCRISGRLAYNKENMRQAQELAERYLANLRDQQFEPASALLSNLARLKLEEVAGGITAFELKQFYDTTTPVDGIRRPETVLVYMIHSPKGYITGRMAIVKAGDKWKIEGLQIRDDASF